MYQLGPEVLRALGSGDRGNVGIYPLAFDAVRVTDNRRLGDRLMGDQCAFHFGCSQPVAGNINDIVNPPGDPVIAILIAPGAVAGEILSGIGGEISLSKASVSAKKGSRLARPGIQNHQIAAGRPFENIPPLIHKGGLNAKQRPGRRSGFQAGGAGQR